MTTDERVTRSEIRNGLSFVVVTLLLAGCGQQSAGPQLVIISPHRDEIKIESAEAFQTWFGERAREGREAAVAALRSYADTPSAEARRHAQEALASVLADWNEEDVPDLTRSNRLWAEQPNPANTQKLLEALEAWQPASVQIVWQDIGGGTSQIAKYVQSEFAAHPSGIRIDCIFGGGTEIYVNMADQGFFEKLTIPPAILNRIPPDLNGVPIHDPGQRWFGPMLSSFGILSNRIVLERIGEPMPETWADLGRPGLRNWVGAGDPRMTGSVHMVYEIILQSQGWDRGMRTLMKMGANTHAFIRDSGTLARDVDLGEVATAGCFDGNALSAERRFPEMMTYSLPPGETAINADAIAVLKGAPHRGLAQAFVEFTLSEAGQRVFCLQPGQPGGPRRYALCRLSSLPALYEEFPPAARSTGATNPFTVKNTVRYDNARGGRRWNVLNDLYGAWIVDAHPDLKEAWRAILASRLSDAERARLEDELFQPPCSEAELNDAAKQMSAGGPRARTLILTRWGEEARARYRRVRLEAQKN
jgi:ABC-type Fe3+ transport system substrate-binding protein